MLVGPGRRRMGGLGEGLGSRDGLLHADCFTGSQPSRCRCRAGFLPRGRQRQSTPPSGGMQQGHIARVDEAVGIHCLDTIETRLAGHRGRRRAEA